MKHIWRRGPDNGSQVVIVGATHEDAARYIVTTTATHFHTVSGDTYSRT
jgi:hypothetical protein